MTHLLLITHPLLTGIPAIRHGFTTRLGGVSQGPFASLNLGLSTGDDPERVGTNRQRVAAAFGVAPGQVIRSHQVHGVTVHEVVEPPDRLPEADALMTDQPGWLLSGLSPDCPILLLVDPERPAVAVAHAGWRGTLAGMAMRVVEAMQEAYRSRPGALRALLCPAIGGCCYQVSWELAHRFQAEWPEIDAVRTPAVSERPHLDLLHHNRVQLLQAGVDPAHLADWARCTACEEGVFFSYRRDTGQTGRQAGFIGLVGNGGGLAGASDDGPA